MNSPKNNSETVTFTVNDTSGKLKPHIKACFLSSILIDTSNPPPTLRAPNGLVYQAIYDSFSLPPSTANKIVPAIASFQQHDNGNFVVIRNLQREEPELTDFYFTFPSTSSFCNGYMIVSASTEAKARAIMIEEYGDKPIWAFIYTEEDFFSQIKKYNLYEVPFGYMPEER